MLKNSYEFAVFFLFQYFPSKSKSGFQGLQMKLGSSEVADIENTMIEYLQNNSDSSVSKIFEKLAVSQYVVIFFPMIFFREIYVLYLIPLLSVIRCRC